MKGIARILLFILLVLPIPANAQTTEELRAQAQALLLKIQELQLQLGASTATPGTPGIPSGVVVDSSACPQVGRVLGVGSSGDDVTRLQQFLARDPNIYPERIISGYYGSLTEAAVKRWQARFNIVSSGTAATTGFGQVGPRTAAAMSLQCSTYSGGGGGSSTVGGYIRVTPISGNTPLTVSVEATVNTVNACTPATYAVEYGDGTAGASITVPAGTCKQMVQIFTHTYSTPGTYLVTLSSGAHRTSATVIVSGSTSQPPPPVISDSVSASPTNGAAPLTVQFSGVMNSARSCNGGTYTLVFGDGQSTELAYPADSCQSFAFTVTHQYTAGGTFTAQLFKGSQSGALVANISITVTGTTTVVADSINATPVTGAVPLSVTFSGIINGSRSCGGGSYTLVFGDGQSTQLQYPADGCQAFSYSIAHQYTDGGTFTVQLYRGAQGSTLAAATTVSASGSSSSYSIVSVTPAVGGNIYATSVQISYPTCGGYSFSWGDGTAATTVSASGGCSGSNISATLNHTYTSGGSYTVALRDGNGILKATASVVISN